MHTIVSPAVKTYLTPSVDSSVRQVCQWIAPLWDLENFVAVNPFLGFAGHPISAAAQMMHAGLDAQVLPALSFYRERWQAGAFGAQDLAAAAQRAGHSPAWLTDILQGKADMPLRPVQPLYTFAERYDQQHATHWHAQVLRHVTSWCAANIPTEPTTDRAPRASGLYDAWRSDAQVDRALELQGLAGWRNWVGQLPSTPLAAIEALLGTLQVPPSEHAAYLYRLLAGVFGWAAYLRRAAWPADTEQVGALLDLLAIRICSDAAVAQLAPRSARSEHKLPASPPVEDEHIRLILQTALENGYTRQLFARIAPPAAHSSPPPAVQAVFCIDVRSEVLRRHLEACTPVIETRGFAGFFAVFLDWQTQAGHSARCPVLLPPALTVAAQQAASGWDGQPMLKQLLGMPAAYTLVETLGLGYALGLAGDALGWRTAPRADEGGMAFRLDADQQAGIAPEARIELAALILKNMGLREQYGRIVLLAGHEGQSENNPHQAGLDCGACGGHGGALNARIAAAILNDPAVRAALPAHGFAVPASTQFVPAVHDTSSDQVRLLDRERIPASHHADIQQLEAWLATASANTRAERATRLGMQASPPRLLDRLVRRARDWSEVRPEWALARNAAFIAARRGRTRGADLAGRAFLHDYDWTTDPDNSILTLILTAPLVVASWINLQYFASTVDNDTFGCGSKTLHNRVGSAGVVLGNGGDLRTGLPLQSVQAAHGQWYHEPLRLQVVVEAPRERIAAVLAAHRHVRELVEHGWLRLFALDPDGPALTAWVAGQGWE